MTQKRFSTPIDVRFRDLDAMGHVNNAVFFTYFEQGRFAFFNNASPGGKFQGFHFILARISCDYLRPVTIDDCLAIEIRVGQIGRKSFTFTYSIVDRQDAGIVFATGESVQVCFDYRKNATMPVSEALKVLLQQFAS